MLHLVHQFPRQSSNAADLQLCHREKYPALGTALVSALYDHAADVLEWRGEFR